MTGDTAARKRRALEMLTLGASIGTICQALELKRHKIRLWKQTDDVFRRRWNEVMVQLGRTPEIEREGEKE